MRLLAGLFTRIWAVFLAAFVFVFNPQMLTFTLASGVANRLNLVWIPLFFIAIDLWVRGHKKKVWYWLLFFFGCNRLLALCLLYIHVDLGAFGLHDCLFLYKP